MCCYGQQRKDMNFKCTCSFTDLGKQIARYLKAKRKVSLRLYIILLQLTTVHS